MLSNQSIGTFLIRFSSSRNDGYALEFVEDLGKIRTVFIRKDPKSVPHLLPYLSYLSTYRFCR